MSNDIKAVELIIRKGQHYVVPGMFDLVVSFHPLVKNNDKTGVELRKVGSDALVARVVIGHPFDVDLNESNWASYLYLNAELQGRLIKAGQSRFAADSRPWGFREIRTNGTIGRFYFEIQTENKTYGVITDRPANARVKIRRHPNALLIKEPRPDVGKTRTVMYNNRGIVVINVGEEEIGKGAYYAHYRNRMLPYDEIETLAMGLTQCPIDPISFLTLGEVQELKKRDDNHALLATIFHGFCYLKSVDGEVILTLQKNPVQEGFRAIKEHLVPDVNTGNSMNVFFGTRYSELLTQYALGADDRTNDKEILLKIIDIIETELTVA